MYRGWSLTRGVGFTLYSDGTSPFQAFDGHNICDVKNYHKLLADVANWLLTQGEEVVSVVAADADLHQFLILTKKTKQSVSA